MLYLNKGWPTKDNNNEQPNRKELRKVPAYLNYDNLDNLDTKPEDDDVPEARTTDIKTGDLYKLGEHRLLCGDSTKVCWFRDVGSHSGSHSGRLSGFISTQER